MIIRDWRDLPFATLEPLYAAERERWVGQLSWDSLTSLETVESGRVRGYVPGFVAFDRNGAAVGWTYFVLHDGQLQIGGLSASRPVVARALLDAVLDAPEAQLARSLSCFVFPDGSGIASALTRQRFQLHDTLYLSRPTDAAAPPRAASPATIRGWREWDLPLVARLLQASYDQTPGAQPFAPDGRPEQWSHYTAQLIGTPACGTFDPALSYVATEEHGLQLHGAVVTTRIAADAAHIAQVAVAPPKRRQGLAERLVTRALDAAARAGITTATLMVDGRNTGARALYERLGFQERARFIYGRRAARTRIAA